MDAEKYKPLHKLTDKDRADVYEYAMKLSNERLVKIGVCQDTDNNKAENDGR